MSEFEQWRAVVERGLKGAPLDSLVTTTLEGILIAPLYTERDRLAAEGIPWAPRETRGLGAVLGVVETSDLVRERAAGATLVWTFGRPTEVVVPEGLEVVIESRTDPGEIAELSGPRMRAIADPWSAGVAASGAGEADAVSSIAGALGRGHAALGSDASVWHERGGTAIDELGLGLASLVESLRALDALSVAPDRALAGTTFAVSLGTDFFLEVAKLRALRRLLARLAGSLGTDARPTIAARTSLRAMSQLDPSTNLVRESIALAAGLIGGADLLAALPHAMGADGASATTTGQGATHRAARNASLVLALESALDRPHDPARGSAYVEQVTSELARRAWDLFRDVERLGGLRKARSFVVARLATAREARRAEIATRRMPLVGVSRFPARDDAQHVVGVFRDAFAFERLRDRGDRIPVRVAAIGACPEARIDFAREIAQLASRDVEVVRSASGESALDGLAHGGLVLSPGSIVILAAPDALFATDVVAAARALRSAGAKGIAVAGKPGAHEQALRDAGVDAFVFVGADIVAALEALLDRALATEATS